MAMTNAERQRAFRQRKQAEGLVSVTVMVHPSQAAELTLACELLRMDRDLVLATLRNVRSGQFKKIA